MTNDLGPCPFCGGDAKEFTGEDAAPHRWTVECDSCGAHVGSDTRHKARAKWNRRSERTCRVVSAKECGGVGYAPGCSECGWQMADSMWHNYCPNCGARVMDE